MAKITSLFPPQGTLGNTVFRRQKDGTTVAYMLPIFDKEKWRKNEEAIRSHENAQEFGGAAKAGSAIYKALVTKTTRAMFRPYTHNYIAKKLRRNAQRPQHRRAAEQYSFQAAIPALKNLDLSHKDSPSKLLKLTSIGPNHRPNSVKVQGIREAAAQIDPTGKTELEFRITRKTLQFPEITYDAQQWEWSRTQDAPLQTGNTITSKWIPIDCFPKEGMAISMAAIGDQLEGEAQTPATVPSPNANPDELVFLLIEWRQIRGKKRKPKLLPAQGIVRLAAIRTTLEHAQELAQNGIQTPRRTKRYCKLPPAQPIQRLKHRNPAYYLKVALGGLLATPPA